ncbi:hypothetical protein BKH43_00320 [Helicobacter sp. 13S00401-1]|uniref:YggT family protein n=1 Tax=Helicobacter sp. 13S00401-1 TaxID=1905758 RepID=UPI000BA6126D|nr:YggT family protein [Helicobacter sp. 13S00401-1]PAF51721.1 hypothetical protein BKH43_00320 [Helicobacter sp. 13S00401-1]
MIVVHAIGIILHYLVTIYSWVIFVAAIISLVQPDPYNPIVQFLRNITEPAYRLIKRVVPTVYKNMDFAPLIAIIILQFIDLTLVRVLVTL